MSATVGLSEVSLSEEELHPTALWNISIKCTEQFKDLFVFMLQEMGIAVAWSHEPQNELYTIVGTRAFRQDPMPDGNNISQEFIEWCAQFQLPVPIFTVEKLPEKNWLAENRASFPPLKQGRFFIYGSHYTDQIPENSISLKIDAAMAFGSGEHATTQGCLQALEYLKNTIDDNTIETNPSYPSICLDMGCGSGILALAMGKLWPSSIVTACDNDPFAVNTTHENGILNKVKIHSLLGDGYHILSADASFDIVTSNILAEPLCHMAPQAYSFLKSKGFLILSGFYTHQVEKVLNVHEQQGFIFHQQFTVGDWATLIFNKP